MSLFNKMTLLKWANKDENRCVAIFQLKVLNTHSTAISSFIKITSHINSKIKKIIFLILNI